MRVDFYQLSRDPVELVLPSIATRVLAAGERLLIVAAESARLDAISAKLWDAGPTSFLAHDHADAEKPEVQPILLSPTCEPVNGASHIALADGDFREQALGFARAFFFFDAGTIEGARTAWRDLAKREDVEPHFWKQDGGRWREGP